MLEAEKGQKRLRVGVNSFTERSGLFGGKIYGCA